MLIRKAKLDEIIICNKVIEDAKRIFKEEGSTQWQDRDGYPNTETLKKDYENNQLYVVEENKEIISVFVFSLLIEECYKNISEGNWKYNGDNYGVLHRIAVLNSYRKHGIGMLIMNYIEKLAKEFNLSAIKVDTMECNTRMINLLIKANYHKCGIIYLLRKDVLDTKRVAFEKLMED